MALKAMIALLSLFFILDPVVFVMAGKDEKMGRSVLDASFVSSGSDWSKDLDGIKPYGPSAQSANLSPEIGYEAYRTFRFKLIRTLIRTGPNLWNSLCYFASKATKPISLSDYDGYGSMVGTTCLQMDPDEENNALLCQQRALNIVYELLLPGPWLSGAMMMTRALINIPV